MKKQISLILSAIFIVCLLVLFDIEITNPSLATDSGFDTSYDSGSSGGFSDSGYSGGSSGGFGSSSSSSSGEPMSPDAVCFFLLIFPIVLSVAWHPKKKWKKICKIVLRISIVIIYMLIFYNTISHKIETDTAITMFISGATLLASFAEDSNYMKQSSDISDNFEKEYRIRNYISKSSINLDTTTKERVFKQSYQIYLAVQQAWMNFDYDALRVLVTDELFNTYQTQLQTLELKGQKNIMKDFVLLDWRLLSANEENSIRTFSIMLDVEFFDYIVDNQNKVVRGNKKEKVIMTYCLTFVESKEEDIKCPHCGAKIEEGKTICPYCKTNIQGVTTMKLSKKEAVLQR